MSDRPPTPVVEPSKSPPTAHALRCLIRRVHFYAGILTAPFLAMLCLTGIAYVFTPQITDALYAQELLVEPGPGAVRPLDAQVVAAVATQPDAALSSIKPAPAPDRATAVILTPPGAPDGEDLAVYVDPYTAQVTGTLPHTHGEPPVQNWLRDFHGDLQLGTVGAVYSEFAASWLPILFIGGIVLWVGKRRVRRRNLVIPTTARPGRRRIMNWHGSVGIWLTVALVFISLTGLTWSTYAGERFQTVLTALDARSPKLTAEVAPPATGAPIISAGVAEKAGRAAGLQGPLTLTPPAEPGEPYTVRESSTTVPLHRDKIALDPYTGTVVESIRFADYPFLAKLSTIGILAHTGTLFGLANQVALTAMALGILAVIFWGFRMWWLRRPTRRDLRPLEGRGVLASTPQTVLFAVVLGAVLLGWLLPVFGVSLALFLLVDTALGALARRRARTG
ncbi:MAG: PepSY domain-containing protein [Pseudonocardia sp.]|nr:PepSY domain-containing protein [Pseudonocardia sp.]